MFWTGRGYNFKKTRHTMIKMCYIVWDIKQVKNWTGTKSYCCNVCITFQCVRHAGLAKQHLCITFRWIWHCDKDHVISATVQWNIPPISALWFNSYIALPNFCHVRIQNACIGYIFSNNWVIQPIYNTRSIETLYILRIEHWTLLPRWSSKLM